MKCHEFTIVATGPSLDTDEWEEVFYEAGCDDATVSLQRGAFLIDFDREADSFEEAVTSACADVRSAGASILRVEPDPLVSSSDIAERTGLTRQAVSLYTTGGRGENFPIPIACASGSRPLWSWAEVTGWLSEKGKVSADELEQAIFLEQINAEIRIKHNAKEKRASPAKSDETRRHSFTRPEDYVTAEVMAKPAPSRPNFRSRPRPGKRFELRPRQMEDAA